MCDNIVMVKIMLNNGLYLITDEKQVQYFVGYRTADGYAVIDGDKKLFFIDSRYFYAVKKKLASSGWEAKLGSEKQALEYIAETKKTLKLDYRYTNLTLYEKLKALGVEVEDCSKEITSLMIIKSDEELKNIKKACAIAEKAFKETIKLIKLGMTELNVAEILESKFKQFGASGTSFETIVAFGANSAVPHHQTGKTKLTGETVILMDFGCVYNGYCSDMTRTFYFGNNPSKEFKKVYDSVLKAHVTAYENIQSGMTCVVADGFARESLQKDGYDKYFTHSLGHGIGLNIHEAPALSPRGQGEMQDGMVFSIEPGVYLDEKFGVRIEDTVTLINGKPQTFMTVTKKLIKIKS